MFGYSCQAQLVYFQCRLKISLWDRYLSIAGLHLEILLGEGGGEYWKSLGGNNSSSCKLSWPLCPPPFPPQMKPCIEGSKGVKSYWWVWVPLCVRITEHQLELKLTELTLRRQRAEARGRHSAISFTTPSVSTEPTNNELGFKLTEPIESYVAIIQRVKFWGICGIFVHQHLDHLMCPSVSVTTNPFKNTSECLVFSSHK